MCVILMAIGRLNSAPHVFKAPTNTTSNRNCPHQLLTSVTPCRKSNTKPVPMIPMMNCINNQTSSSTPQGECLCGHCSGVMSCSRLTTAASRIGCSLQKYPLGSKKPNSLQGCVSCTRGYICETSKLGSKSPGGRCLSSQPCQALCCHIFIVS